MSEKEQSWRHNSPRLQKILQSYPSQKCWYWHRNRHIDQWSRAESSKINPHTYSNPWMDLGMIILREFRQRKTNNISLICEILKQKWCKSIFTKQTVLFLVEHRYVSLECQRHKERAPAPWCHVFSTAGSSSMGSILMGWDTGTKHANKNTPQKQSYRHRKQT